MTQNQAIVDIPEKLIPVFTGKADVRGSYGGRGSAKTRTFAKMSAVRAYQMAASGRDGIILVARQHLNSLEDSSMAEVKAAIRSESWLEPFFDIGEKYIRTKGLPGRVDYSFSGLDRNIDSIKSKASILLCWVDEGEPVLDGSWEKLIPTIREDGSELWVTWNPERDGSPVDTRFRKTKDPLYKIQEMNWRDNEKFPDKLERERQRDKDHNPDQYEHIWEGGYKKVVKGAYFAKHLTQAKADNRIGRIAPDELITFRAFADIGGTGKKADNFVFWVSQFIGKEIRVVNHYEVQGQSIGHHLKWLRDHGYTPGNTTIWLPHDGETNDKVFDVSYESAFKKAEYSVEIVPNQGTGAAMLRVESTRRVFPNIWFNEDTTQAGRDALGYYHEKIDENRNIGLGPEHDWSSHSADAFGMQCIVYEGKDDAKPLTDPYAAFRRHG